MTHTRIVFFYFRSINFGVDFRVQKSVPVKALKRPKSWLLADMAWQILFLFSFCLRSFIFLISPKQRFSLCAPLFFTQYPVFFLFLPVHILFYFLKSFIYFFYINFWLWLVTLEILSLNFGKQIRVEAPLYFFPFLPTFSLLNQKVLKKC